MGENAKPEEEVLFKNYGDEAEANAKIAVAIRKLRQIGNVSCHISHICQQATCAA